MNGTEIWLHSHWSLARFIRAVICYWHITTVRPFPRAEKKERKIFNLEMCLSTRGLTCLSTSLDGEIQVMSFRLYYFQHTVSLGLYFLISQLSYPLHNARYSPIFSFRKVGKYDQVSREIIAQTKYIVKNMATFSPHQGQTKLQWKRKNVDIKKN